MQTQLNIPIIIIMYVFIIPLTAAYLSLKDRDKLHAVIIKGLCTCAILAAALAGLTVRETGAPIFDTLIILGIALGLIGDVVIGYSFIGGGAAFALGHFFYIGALYIRSDKPLTAVPLWLLLFASAVFIYKKRGLKAGKLEIPAMFYAAIILFMVSLSAAVPAMLPASVLFAASDAMLGIYLMGNKKNKRLDKVSLWCYFIAQSLFAVSVIAPL